MSRFHTDDGLQKGVRDAVIGPGLYGPHSLDGRYIFLDKGRLATILQRRYSVDTILQTQSGEAVAIEEKIVRWPGYKYDSLTLETKSCTVPGHESDGWMVYGDADWLNYAMCQEDGSVLCYFIKFPELKDAFWRDVDLFQETRTTQHNKTVCRLVPLHWIHVNVGVFPPDGRLIKPTPEGAEIVKAYNSTHYKKVA